MVIEMAKQNFYECPIRVRSSQSKAESDRKVCDPGPSFSRLDSVIAHLDAQLTQCFLWGFRKDNNHADSSG